MDDDTAEDNRTGTLAGGWAAATIGTKVLDIERKTLEAWAPHNEYLSFWLSYVASKSLQRRDCTHVATPLFLPYIPRWPTWLRAVLDGKSPRTITGQPFRFFDLPPELRDRVHDHISGVEHRVSQARNKWDAWGLVPRVYIRRAALSMLLANRQLSREYASRMGSEMTLIYSSHEESLESHHPAQATPRLSAKVGLQTKIWHIRHIICCPGHPIGPNPDADPDPGNGCKALDGIADIPNLAYRATDSFPNLEELTVDLGLWWPPGWTRDWTELPHHRQLWQMPAYTFTQAPLKELRLYACNPGSCDADNVVNADRLLATWTPRKEWQVHVAEVKAAPDTGSSASWWQSMRLGKTASTG